MKIAVASDHAGFEAKEQIVSYLKDKGYSITDFGTNSAESMDYPDTAHPLAEAVEKKEYDFGITLCGSGNGINITANKHN
jgi:ribose 5-phosphate isomerase B